MSASLPIGIVTTAGREDYLKKTLESLDYPAVQIFNDLKKGLYGNQVASWNMLFRNGAEHALLFEDDIEASRNWLQATELFIEKLHPAVMALYSGRSAEQAKRVGEGFFYQSPATWLGMPGFYMTRKVWDTFIGMDWKKFFPEEELKDFDWIFSRYLVLKKIRILVTVPSFIQHVGIKSTMGHLWKIGKTVRQTKFYRGKDFDLLAYYRRKFV